MKTTLIASAALLAVIAFGGTITPANDSSVRTGLPSADRSARTIGDSSYASAGKAVIEDAGRDEFSLSPLRSIRHIVATSPLGKTFLAINGGRSPVHNECQDNRCVEVPGLGFDICDSDAECVTSHTTCLGFRCVTVPEPGKDRCSTDADCPAAVATRRACRNFGIGVQCAIVRGSGPDVCATDSECILPEEDSGSEVGGGIPGTGNAIVGDIGFNSDAVPCPAGTIDLGVVESRYVGSFKKESGPLIIRLCQIPDIPGQGNNTFGVEIDGGAVVNSRVAAAWRDLGRQAKRDGIALYSVSSFRLADSCGGTGTGSLCARPGMSPHQLGVAIDFANMSKTGTSTTSCDGRAILRSSPQWLWMYRNAGRYGFEQYTYEAWHWDPLPLPNRCSYLEPRSAGP